MDLIEGEAVGGQSLKKLVGQVICLKSIERKIICLRIYEALPHSQIAKATGLSERSVKRILENVVTKISTLERFEMKGG